MAFSSALSTQPFFCDHPNFKVAMDAFVRRDAQAWVDAWGGEAINTWIHPYFQLLADECVQADWVAGVDLLRQHTIKGNHGWVWQNIRPTDYPRAPLAQAAHFAKPAVCRFLAQGASGEYLMQSFLMAAPSAQRQTPLTQNRVRTLMALGKALKHLPQEERNKVFANPLMLEALLDTQHHELIKTYAQCWETNLVWQDVVAWARFGRHRTRLGGDTRSLQEVAADVLGTPIWGQRLDQLWMHSDHHMLHNDVRMFLDILCAHPLAPTAIAHIYTERERQQLIEGIGEATPAAVRKPSVM